MDFVFIGQGSVDMSYFCPLCQNWKSLGPCFGFVCLAVAFPKFVSMLLLD